MAKKTVTFGAPTVEVDDENLGALKGAILILPQPLSEGGMQPVTDFQIAFCVDTSREHLKVQASALTQANQTKLVDALTAALKKAVSQG
jgi:hypothetical protein